MAGIRVTVGGRGGLTEDGAGAGMGTGTGTAADSETGVRVNPTSTSEGVVRAFATEEDGTPKVGILVHWEFKEGGGGCGSGVGGACCRSRCEVPPLWHELEGVIDSDSPKEGLECTSKLVHLPFHAVQPLSSPTQFLCDLVESLDLCFKNSNPLLLLHVLVLEI